MEFEIKGWIASRVIARGWEAIELVAENGDKYQLNKYNDPIEPAIEDIDIEAAKDVARADDNLIFATIRDGEDLDWSE